jgi:hypothetical protein
MADTSTMACGWIEVQGFSCRPMDDLAERGLSAWWFRNRTRKKAWKGTGVPHGRL